MEKGRYRYRLVKMYPLHNFDVLMSLSNNETGMILNTFTLIENKNKEDLSVYIKKNILKNKDYSIPHSTKIVKGFFKNENPYFIKDLEFNIDNHIFCYDLKTLSDSNISPVKDLLEKIYNKPINFSRPLWEVHIIHNYDNCGNTAIIRRIHHTAVDGELNSKFMNIIFDNFTVFTKKINNKKINLFNCSFSYMKRYILMYLFFIKGFLLRTNKGKNTNLANTVFKHPNIDLSNTEKTHDLVYISYEKIIDIINKSSYTFTDICLYLYSKSYYEWAKSKNIPINNTTNCVIPMSVPIEEKRYYGNDVMGSFINLYLNEENNIDRINKLHKEIQNAILIKKTSPFNYYGKAIQNYPRNDGVFKLLNFVNKTNWNNRKKISNKQEKSTIYGASISVAKLKTSNNNYYLNNNKVLQVYTFPPIFTSKYSLGINVMFRVYKKEMYCLSTSFKHILDEPNDFLKLVEKSLDELYDIIVLKN
jgi:hypothetical protein